MLRFPTRPIALMLTALALAGCSDATAPGDPLVQEEELRPAAPAPAANAEYNLSLHGGGLVTEFPATTPVGETRSVLTTFLASEGELLARGGCCQITGDTLLQINLPGLVGVGDHALEPPIVTVRNMTNIHMGGDEPVLFRQGRIDVVLLINVGARWPTNFTRMFVMSEPAVLTITEYRAPDPFSTNGFVRGRITFVAQEYVRERFADGTVDIRKATGVVRVTAEFAQPLRHRRIGT